MNAPCKSALALVLAACAVACGSPGSSGTTSAAGTAEVSVKNRTYDVTAVTLYMEPGEEAWFRIDGEPAEHREDDCVPGLAGGIGFYGSLPASVRKPDDLAGSRLRVEFSGDGDDHNFCFVGLGGLAGAEDAWITIDSVQDDRVRFSMRGKFRIFDDNGEGPVVEASASGTAIVADMS